MNHTDDIRVVLITAPDADLALSLVRTLVDERLAACGNILPDITSIYRWEGKIHQDNEVLIIMKTTSSAATRLAERVPQLHPYDVPEVIVLPVVTGHTPYLDWVRTESREPKP